MSGFLGHEYNYEAQSPSRPEMALFKEIAHAGDEAINFTLPSVDGETVTLSALRGKPAVIEFGSTP